MLEEPVNHSMTSGMPAANQTPPTFRIRSTGLPHSFGGVGERISSIVKSPSAASATALATGVLETVNGPLGSGPQISVAKTGCPERLGDHGRPRSASSPLGPAPVCPATHETVKPENGRSHRPHSGN